MLIGFALRYGVSEQLNHFLKHLVELADMDAVNQAVVEVERDVERHAAGLLAVFSPCHAWNGIINFEIALRDEARDREPRQAAGYGFVKG